MRYSITYVQAGGGGTTRREHPGTMTAEEAVRFVRRATLKDARDTIARLGSDVPAVTVPYMDNPRNAVEVRVAA